MKSRIRRNVLNLTAYTPGEQPSDPAIVKLNTNENPYPPSPKIAEALAQPLDLLRLYPDPVCMKLREALAKLHNCGIEQIFVGNGSDEVLSLCCRALVEPDGTIGFFDPSYSLYPVLAAIQDLATKPVKLGPEFEWRMEPDYEASLFFLANPNAPTGILYPKDVVRDFCASFPGVVLIDEAYADFARFNCMDLAVSMDNVLVSRTLSKSFSLAGLRLGYVVGPESLIQAFYKIKDSYNVDRLSQSVALAAVNDIEHMRRNVETIKRTRETAAGKLRERGFKVFPSETNFLWAKPRGESAARLFERLKNRKIFVRYFPGPLTGDYLRISIGTEEEMGRLFAAMDSAE